MGRELKRVPMDFNAPLNITWEGYINPYYKFSKQCPFCEGSGQSPEAKNLSDQWYGKVPFRPEDNGSVPLTFDNPAVLQFATKNVLQSDFTRRSGFNQGITEYWEMVKRGETEAYLNAHPSFSYNIEREANRLISMWNEQWSHHLNADDVKALVDAGCLMDFTNRPRNEKQVEQLKKQEAAGGSGYWLKKSNGYMPTPEEVNNWNILMRGSVGDCWPCVKAKLKRMGKSALCAHCKGNGDIWLLPKYRKLAEAWKDVEPPTGGGFQLWETTSDGSPISPVFATLDELCEYAVANCTTFGSFTTTKDEWKSMLDANFVCHREGSTVFI
jgi:hypothetical protein